MLCINKINFKLVQFPFPTLSVSICLSWLCDATCICSHTVRVIDGWGWIAVERVRAVLQGSAARRMVEWCSPPGCRCTSNTQTPAYFTKKCWLVCLAWAPPQINNINPLQILVFSLITKLGALRLNPHSPWGCWTQDVRLCVRIKPITLYRLWCLPLKENMLRLCVCCYLFL